MDLPSSRIRPALTARLLVCLALASSPSSGSAPAPGGASPGDFRSRPAVASAAVSGAGAGFEPSAVTTMPLSFEANQGQAEAEVQFLARIPGGLIQFTPNETRLHAGSRAAGAVRPAPPGLRSPSVVRMRLAGANPDPPVEPGVLLPARSHYVLGSDASRWVRDVPHYTSVRYESVYPGIGVEYHSRSGSLEYDFIVSPGADPSRIRLEFTGAERIEVDAEGNLEVGAETGTLHQLRPLVYQTIGDSRREIAGCFEPLGGGEVGFQLAGYDPAVPLIIDPLFFWYSSYLGGLADDYGRRIVSGPGGSIHIAGSTLSLDFPCGGTPCPTPQGEDAFLTRLAADGSVLSTILLGGSGPDRATGLAIDRSGNLYLAGESASNDFPLSSPLPCGTCGVNNTNAFLASVDALDNLRFSTLFGGGSTESQPDVAVDDLADVYLAGRTDSSDFFQQPTLPNPPGTDAFLAKFRFAGSVSLRYSLLIGGAQSDWASGVAVDPLRAAYVVGGTDSIDFPLSPTPLQPRPGGCPASCTSALSDSFLTKVTATDQGVTEIPALAYSTFFGGSASDEARAVAVDDKGRAYLTGKTMSADLRVFRGFQTSLAGASDAFVAVLAPGSLPSAQLEYSTYLGGIEPLGEESGSGIFARGDGRVLVTGVAASADFPGGIPPIGGPNDVFLTEIATRETGEHSLLGSSGHGGSSDEQAGGVHVANRYCDSNIYLTGTTNSTDFPIGPTCFPPQFPCTTVEQPQSGGPSDAFLVKWTLVGSVGGCAMPSENPPAPPDRFCCDPCCTRFCPGDTLRRDEFARIILESKPIPPLPQSTPASFVDVPSCNPYFGWVESLFAQSVTAGCLLTPGNERYFCPTEIVPRWQAAVLLSRLYGLTLNPPTGRFDDVPATDPLATAIEAVASAAGLTGCRNDTLVDNSVSPPQVTTFSYFCPNDAITRAELTRVIWGLLGSPALPPCQQVFQDVDQGNLFCPFIEFVADRVGPVPEPKLTCHNGVQDANEDSIDCGSYCGPRRGQADGTLRPSCNERYFGDGYGQTRFMTGSHTWYNLVDIAHRDVTAPPPITFNFADTDDPVDNYLSFLESNNHNFIRLWSWMPSKADPDPDKPADEPNFYDPPIWSRPGPGNAADGKPKFDLDVFNHAFFDRLRERVEQAADRGIYVSVNLFESYDAVADGLWKYNPSSQVNNINGVVGVQVGFWSGIEKLSPPCASQPTDKEKVMCYQQAYVRKVLDTLAGFDNVLYEICNECPFAGNDPPSPGTTVWQKFMVDLIQGHDRAPGRKQHPVGISTAGNNIPPDELALSNAEWIGPDALAYDKSWDPYLANPPILPNVQSVPLRVVISDTDHHGREIFELAGGDVLGRKWAWKSFTRGMNTILMEPVPTLVADGCRFDQVGKIGGNGDHAHWKVIRRAMGYTRSFADEMDLVAMQPEANPALCSSTFCLRSTDEHLVYLPGGGSVSVDLAPGNDFTYRFFDPTLGLAFPACFEPEGSKPGGGTRTFDAPDSAHDWVLHIVR